MPGDLSLRDGGNRCRGLGRREHERKARRGCCLDEVEIAAAARHAEDRLRASVAKATSDEVRDRRHGAGWYSTATVLPRSRRVPSCLNDVPERP